MAGLSDLAQKKKDAEAEMKEQKRARWEQTRKDWTPRVALVIANVIFLSLDARAFDVVLKLTASYFLAAATVIVSGALALLWWDVFYPHSRRHSNDWQIKISIAGVSLGIILSLVLAFLDYIVDSTAINISLLWGVVIILTGLQGIMLAWWWLIDNSIEADAKRQKSIANRLDLQETADDLKAEIESMETLSTKLDDIKKKFPGKGQAHKAALAMGFPVLAKMLEDANNNGIPDFLEEKPKNSQQPQKQVYASDVNQPRQTQQAGQGKPQQQDGDTNRPTNGQAQK